MLLCGPVSLGAWSNIGQAVAGNEAEDARREREEAKREREERRREREEARKQREEQRAAREAARREREEAKAAREEARREREEQRAALEAARAQQRAQAAMERETARNKSQNEVRPISVVREDPIESPQVPSTRDSGIDKRSVAPDQGREPANRQEEVRETATSTKKDENATRRGTGQTTRKIGETPRADKSDKASTKSVTSNTKASDKSDAQDAKGEPMILEPEEEPRTFVDWWKRITDTPAKDAAVRSAPSAPVVAPPSPAPSETVDTRTGPVKVAPTPVASVVSPTVPSSVSPPRVATASPKPTAKADTSSNAISPAKQATKATGAAPSAAYNGVKIKGVDQDLFNLGQFRTRQIMASGLDGVGLSKAEAMGFKALSSVATPGFKDPVRTLTIPTGLSEDAAQQRLAQAIPEGHFGPNHVYRIAPAGDAAASKDGAASGQCAKPECLARELIDWQPDLAACGQGVRIGIIDTSFDLAHPAFARVKVEGKDFRPRNQSGRDDWHGTAVLSVLAADGQTGPGGLVPGALYFVASTFGTDAKGRASADAMSVLAALAWLDGKVDIINMSFSGPRNEEIELAINAMAAKGVVFVAAAGNDGPNGPASYPAAYSQVVAVTAVSRAKNSYRHATHGDYIDFAAPGVEVQTALPRGQIGLRTGTSFAVPFVTSLLAATRAVRQGNPTKEELLARISSRDLGEPGRDRIFGEGLPIAPATCHDIGGVAALPWTQESKMLAKVRSGTTETVAASDGTASLAPDTGSAMTQAFGFAP